ncbi:uncharacterized protein LOC120407835 isoform X2 [Mauremys reevesii]|uniref:uncharacterized protein LOC120407835 isoform X2 n=1 Tax=Mauremys reevesii TaxID=260615 RepID=UPI0019401396|nr:uncharacterized protein LOC120407835 isoform X2 [Mauremys reevesii]
MEGAPEDLEDEEHVIQHLSPVEPVEEAPYPDEPNEGPESWQEPKRKAGPSVPGSETTPQRGLEQCPRDRQRRTQEELHLGMGGGNQEPFQFLWAWKDWPLHLEETLMYWFMEQKAKHREWEHSPIGLVAE